MSTVSLRISGSPSDIQMFFRKIKAAGGVIRESKLYANGPGGSCRQYIEIELENIKEKNDEISESGVIREKDS